jgi:hypothetical protein
MPFDSSSAYSVVTTNEGNRYFLQSGAYYVGAAPYASVPSPDLDGPAAGLAINTGTGSATVSGSVSLSSLLFGEDSTVGRLMNIPGVKWSALQTTAGGASTLIQTGKTVLVAIVGVAAGTSYVLTPRDNPTTTAGGTSFPIGFTNAANTNTTDAYFKGGAYPIFNTGLVIDATGTAGSYFILYV